MQADNGSFVYVMPTFQPSYNSYGSCLPVTTFGVDGHYLGQQAYSPSPMFQPSLGSPGYYPNTLPYGELVPSPYAWDPSVFVGDATYTYGYSGVPDSKYSVSSASHTRTPFSKKVANSNFNNHSEMKSSFTVIGCLIRPLNMGQISSQMYWAEVTSPLGSFQCIIKGRVEFSIQITLLIAKQKRGVTLALKS